jgi:hypothetical protein
VSLEYKPNPELSSSAIVVVAFNRPDSLERLLKSIGNALFDHSRDIPLIISIDRGNSEEVLDVAKEFTWPHGTKDILYQSEHLGLKDHILQCGDLTYKYGSIIVLEDDLVVSPEFYNYALSCIKFFSSDEHIAGISLYSYNYSETARLPFYPVDDDFDNFFMQVPSSWGQAWTAEQWKKFRDYDQSKLDIAENDTLPVAVKHWSHHSWKKQFYKYLSIESKFFVYPRKSFTTNFADKGSNSSSSQNLYQVPLKTKSSGHFNFVAFDQSASTYDSFFELIINKNNLHLFPEFIDLGVTIDTYGTKPLTDGNSCWVSTKPCSNPLKQWDISMLPMINNVIYNNEGTLLSYARAKE